MRAKFRRVPEASQAQRHHDTLTFPAPIRGKISNENLAASKPQGARVLENWFPTTTSIRLRGGLKKKATIGGGPVVSMFNYDGSAGRFMFAADATSVYNVTSPASPSIAPSPAFSGQTSGYYSYVQFPTAGGDFLSIVNGTDSMRQFDGTTWTTVASLGVNINTNKLSHVWTYRNREFFVQKGTLVAWFLPVNQISGTALDFTLAGVFQKGGSLLFGGTWSLDAGDGVDDKCVFVSDKGEVAVYEGSNPADASNWSLVGRYDMSPPRGNRASMQAGGELLIAMDDGIIPISQAIQKDRAALGLISVSRNIEPDWRLEAGRRTLPWEILKWPLFNMAIVSLPASTGQDKKCFVVNLQTGAWADYTGWDTRCLVLHDGWAYFGTSDGKVMQCELSGSDDGMPYVATYVGLFDHMKSAARDKVVHLGRAVFLAGRKFIAKLSVSTNYQVSLPSAPASVANDVSLDEWDTGLWDVALWDAGSTKRVSTKWTGIGQSGFSVAPQIQVTCGVTPTPDAELVAIDVTYEVGDVVV
jgi:hypothetical protein